MLLGWTWTTHAFLFLCTNPYVGDQKLIENYQLVCPDSLLETFFSIQSYGLGLETFARKPLLFACACFGHVPLFSKVTRSTQPFHIPLLWFFKHSFLLHVLMFCFLVALGSTKIFVLLELRKEQRWLWCMEISVNNSHVMLNEKKALLEFILLVFCVCVCFLGFWTKLMSK